MGYVVRVRPWFILWWILGVIKTQRFLQWGHWVGDPVQGWWHGRLHGDMRAKKKLEVSEEFASVASWSTPAGFGFRSNPSGFRCTKVPPSIPSIERLHEPLTLFTTCSSLVAHNPPYIWDPPLVYMYLYCKFPLWPTSLCSTSPSFPILLWKYVYFLSAFLPSLFSLQFGPVLYLWTSWDLQNLKVPTYCTVVTLLRAWLRKHTSYCKVLELTRAVSLLLLCQVFASVTSRSGFGCNPARASECKCLLFHCTATQSKQVQVFAFLSPCQPALCRVLLLFPILIILQFPSEMYIYHGLSSVFYFIQLPPHCIFWKVCLTY